MHHFKLPSAIILALCVTASGCDDSSGERPGNSQTNQGGKADDTQNDGAGAITTQTCEDLAECWENDDLSRCAVSIWEGEPQASESLLVDTCCENLEFGYCFEEEQGGDDGGALSCEAFDDQFFTCLGGEDDVEVCVSWAEDAEDGEVLEDCCNSGDPLDVCEYLASYVPTNSCGQIEADFNSCLDELSYSYCEGDFRLTYPDGGACCVGEFEYDHCYIYED